MQNNPFLTIGYISEEYFCNRENETEKLLQNINSGNNITLVSQRRMGKTGLILHVFEKLKLSNGFETIYVDIFSSNTLEDFIKLLAESILKTFPEKTQIGKNLWDFIKSLRPLITFDGMTGEPQVQINYQTENEKTSTIQSIFKILEKQDKKIVVAIDEFQQITEYPEKNIEAILRTQIQHLHNTTFIFCGSKRKLMIEMFADAKRPFYASTQFMYLDKIDRNKYAEFIKFHFNENHCNIENEAVELILNWTKVYTFYTQKVCNKIFSYSLSSFTTEHVYKAFSEIIEENKLMYLQIRELLTKAQWNYLIAIAKEDGIVHVNAQEFLMKYKIGTASNSKRLLTALCEKELIFENISLNNTSYSIYDVFLYHWLKETY